VVEHTARLGCAARVNGSFAHVDVLDDALFIDYKGRAVSEPFLLIQNPVVLGDGSHEVAQKRKLDPNLLSEDFVRGRTVNADAQDLRTALLEFGDISLICLQLRGSTPSEGEHVKR
jgi:hypothetical protein